MLYQEPHPAIYVYHQQFESEGKTHNRRGFMVRCRLERFGEGKIYPHEETLSGPKQDRLQLTRACRANLSQIFGLFPDEKNTVQDLLDKAVAASPATEATDHLGVVHRMWAVSDEARRRASNRLDGTEAAVHRRRPPPLRNGLQLPRRTGRGGKARARPSGEFRVDDVRRHERSRPAGAADASAVSRLAGDGFAPVDRQARAAFHHPRGR